VTKFFLQAGSFPKQADADRVRAQIILLGQAVTVESGTVKEATWYRVFGGPVQQPRATDRGAETIGRRGL